MVPKKVITSLLLLYMTAMLAKESEGYLAFYSREDFRRMQEKEKNQAQKKSLDTRDFFEFAEDEGQVIKMIAPVEIGIHLKSKQLEKYQDVLKELLTEVLSDTKNDFDFTYDLLEGQTFHYQLGNFISVKYKPPINCSAGWKIAQESGQKNDTVHNHGCTLRLNKYQHTMENLKEQLEQTITPEQLERLN